MKISFSLSWPPSVNTYWRRNGSVYFINKKGIAYRKEVLVTCHEFRNAFIDQQRLKVVIDAYPPDKRRRDLDNHLKSLLDAIEKASVYKDDEQIDELTIKRCKPNSGKVDISIEEIKY